MKHRQAAERAAADLEGHPAAAELGEPRRLRSWGQHEKKDPSGDGGHGWGLVRTTNSGRLELGAKKATGSDDFDPGAFPNLYKVAHSEMTVDKSNNSTSGLSAPMLARVLLDPGDVAAIFSGA